MVRRERWLPLALSLALVPSFGAHAAGPLLPYMVKDISPGGVQYAPRLDFWSSTLGEVVFFGVTEEIPGLWRTDGTSAGTHRVYDGIPDRHVGVAPPVKWKDALYYPVPTDDGFWLCRTDGTASGSSAVVKIPDWFGGAPCGDDKLCFASYGSGVAVTDGTPAGTLELLSTASGFESFRSREMTSTGQRVFFNAYDEHNGTCMSVPAGLGERVICGELWTSDGTLAGTHLFKDLLPGRAPGAPEQLFAASDGRLYFAAADPADPAHAQAWVSDGTVDGTRTLMKHGSDWMAPPRFVEIAGRIFFTDARADLFETDGTLEGTRSIRERFPTEVSSVKAIDSVGGQILLIAGNAEGEHELWLWNGTTFTKLVVLRTPFRYLGYLQSTRQGYFVTDTGEMWSTDGTADGTGFRFNVRRGGTFYPVAVTPTSLYYGEAYNRYVSDGTEAGTRQIDLNVPVANDTRISRSKVINDTYFFVSPGKIGASDGTEAGTVVLSNDGGSEPFAHEGHTYFFKNAVLWKTDGTIDGTFPAREWLGVDFPLPPAFIGDQAIFAELGSSRSVFRRDPDGTVHELGIRGGFFSPFVSVAGGVAFTIEGTRLMFSDGTVDGTRMIASGFQSAIELISLGTRVIFEAVNPTSGTSQLWVSDFTRDGTRLLKELPHTGVHPLLRWKDLSIFRVGPVSLWRSDGTTEGTFQLTAEDFDAVLIDGDELALVRFTPDGYEMWASDGTAAGTTKRATYPGVEKAGQPFVMSGGGVGVIYTVNATEVQIRNHRTNAVYVIDAGSAHGLSNGAGNGEVVFFGGYRSSAGHELWAVRLDAPVPSPPSSVSIDYRGIAKTPTGMGAVFRVRVDPNGAAPPTVIATTVDGTLAADRDYVPFTREIVFESDHDVALVVPLRRRDAHGTLGVVLSAPRNAVIVDGIATAHVGGSGRRRTVRP